jgi:2-oxoglutarate dehydrogenase E1 component
LDPEFYGFTEKDMERTFYVDVPQLGGILAKKKSWKLREIVEALQNAYCKKIGIEYMHMHDHRHKSFIRDEFELRQYTEISS